MLSYMLGICFAEYVLNIVPQGTHDWNKFIEPMSLIKKCEEIGFSLIHLQGAEYDILHNEMKFSKSTDINYLVAFRKK